MISVRVPATSANLGPGFDCLGLALNLYSTFSCEPADELIFEGVDEKYRNENNLFVKAYRAAGGTGGLHLIVNSQIPVSRGLGSSASLLAGGALCAMIMNHCLDRQRLFEIVADLEGHPDNAAPAVFGGLTASMKGSGWITRRLPIHESLRFTVLIPDQEVETERARALFPGVMERKTAAENAAKAILMSHALAAGDLFLLKEAAKDQIHEPYRKQLIPHFDTVRTIAEQDQNGAMVISGSGSACLFLGTAWLSEAAEQKIRALPEHWDVKRLLAGEGASSIGEEEWQTII